LSADFFHYQNVIIDVKFLKPTVNITLNECYVSKIGSDPYPSAGSQDGTGQDACPASLAQIPFLAFMFLLDPTQVFQFLWMSELMERI
jgi:hypothetical protein